MENICVPSRLSYHVCRWTIASCKIGLLSDKKRMYVCHSLNVSENLRLGGDRGRPAGITAATAASSFGKSVALADSHQEIGGAGINTRTVPSKTLRETALALSGLKSRNLYGVDLSLRREVTVAGIYTIPEVSMVGETEESLKKKGVAYIVGRAGKCAGPDHRRPGWLSEAALSSGRSEADRRAYHGRTRNGGRAHRPGSHDVQCLRESLCRRLLKSADSRTALQNRDPERPPKHSVFGEACLIQRSPTTKPLANASSRQCLRCRGTSTRFQF
jgi:hypothetical protein